MFERFTERSREVVVKAQEFARERGDAEISPTHLLYGLFEQREDDEHKMSVRILKDIGVEKDAFLAWVGEPDAKEVTVGQIPFDNPAKKILQEALRTALGFGHNYIGTEHLLISLARTPCPASGWLVENGADDERVTQAATTLLMGRSTEAPEPPAYNGFKLSVLIEHEGVEVVREECYVSDIFGLATEMNAVGLTVDRARKSINDAAVRGLRLRNIAFTQPGEASREQIG